MNGIEISERWRGPGEMEPVVLAEHRLTLQINGPVPFEITRDGQFHSAEKVPGSLFLTPAGTRIGLRWLADHHYLILKLHPAVVASILADPALGRSTGLVEKSGAVDPQAAHLLRALQLDAADGHPSGRLYTEILVRALVLRLMAGNVVDKVSDSKPDPVAIRRVRDYLEAHLTDNPSLADLSRVAGLSPHHLARTFSRLTGLPPHRYLLTRRLERAKLLLAQTPRPIAEIACELGFSSQGHFNRVFRKQVGVPPGAFRRDA